MSESPWKNMAASDPDQRVYDLFAHSRPDPERVHGTPVYRDADLSAAMFTLLPGQSHEPHTHAATSHAWIVLAGEGVCLMEGGRVEPLRTGTLCIHKKTTLHGVRNTGTVDLVYLTVSVVDDDGSASSGV
jgi:mannose-6-phosphate isomerase-like protein (cupin superfamily)